MTGDGKSKIRNFFQQITELGMFYGLKFSPALKSFAGSRLEGVIETAHIIFHNPFNFLELYKLLKKKFLKNAEGSIIQ